MNNRKIKKVTFSLLAVLTIPAALLYTNYAISNQPKTVSIKEDVPAPRVTIQRIDAGNHASIIEGYGEVKSAETLALLGQVSGRVVWKSDDFEVGKRVKEGALLVQIENSNYRAELDNAKKSLADANLALLQEKRKYKRAQDDWKRTDIKDKPTLLVLRQPQLEIAKAQYAAAKSAVELANKNLSYTKIYAPFDAVVTARTITQSSYVSQGSNIGELKASKTAKVKIALSEREWRQLPKLLDTLNVKLYSTLNEKQYWNGWVSDLSLVIDQSTRTRQLTIVVDDPLEQKVPLLFGHFVDIKIEGKQQENSFVIDSSSMTADGFIWFEQNEKLRRYKVDILFRNTRMVGIDKGSLSEQINLIKKPLSHYVEGMKVAAIEVTKADVEVSSVQ